MGKPINLADVLTFLKANANNAELRAAIRQLAAPDVVPATAEPRLPQLQLEVWRVLCVHNATGKEIFYELKAKGIITTQQSLENRVLPTMKKKGIIHNDGDMTGYYLAESKPVWGAWKKVRTRLDARTIRKDDNHHHGDESEDRS